MTRRTLLGGLAAAAFAKSPIRLHTGNYGLQSIAVDEALATVRRIGYDGFGLCAILGWPSEPKMLAESDRRRIRESGFPIPTILDSYNLLASDAAHRSALDRLRAAAELAHDVAPGNPPLVQTVLGGATSDWPAQRDRMAVRLEEWGRVAAANRIRLAVKAHAMQAADTPGKLVWLLDKVKHPAITAIYDYGHFQLAGLGIEETMRQLLPRSAFLTVKDSKLVEGKPRFLLPGDGTVDYGQYFKTVRRMNWQGWVLVEITRQLQTQPGYDGLRAAERSYRHMAAALRNAGLR